MYATTLRKVGGSVMLALPPAILELMRVGVGASVDLAVQGDRLVVERRRAPRYTLSELLEGSDYSVPRSPGEREWVDAPRVGRELL